MIGGSISLALAGAGIAGLDKAVARATATDLSPPAMDGVLTLLDLAMGKEISTFLLGFVLLIVAGALLVPAGTRRAGWLLLYVALVQFLATSVVDLSKTPFGRLRPSQAIADGGGLDRWFVDGQSFPSGHTAFYAGLFLPLVLLLPRWTLLWVIVPLFVAGQRVLSGDHYWSDVFCSLGLAALLAAALAGIARRGEDRLPRGAGENRKSSIGAETG